MTVSETIELMKMLNSFNFDRSITIGTLLFVEDGYSVAFAISEAVREHLSKEDWLSRLIDKGC